MGSNGAQRRIAIVAAVLLLAGAGAWLVLRRSGEAQAIDDVARKKPDVETPAQRLAGRDAPPPSPPDAAKTPEGGKDEEHDVPPAPSDGTVTVRVSFVGAGPRPAKLVLLAEPDDCGEIRARLVLQGDATTGQLPKARHYSFWARLDDWDSDQLVYGIEVPEDRRIDVAIRVPASPVLRVEERSTGKPLRDAFALAVRGDDFRSSRMPVPGVATLGGEHLAADADGRIRLPVTADTNEWWVRAPGYSWRRVKVPPETVPEVRIALEPGGDLRIAVDGWGALEDPVLVLAQPRPDVERGSEEEASSFSMDQAPPSPDASGTCLVEGLTVGTWSVVVGLKGGWELAEVWARTEATVVPGRTTEVALHVDPPPKPTLVDVDVEAFVPPAWGREARVLVLRGATRKNSGVERRVEIAADEPGPSFHRHMTGLREGLYALTVGPPEWSVPAWVRKDTTSLRIEVPPPVRLRVRVLDEAGQPLARAADVIVESLTPWAPAGSVDAEIEGDPALWQRLEREAEGMQYVGVAPAGAGSVQVRAPGWVAADVPATFAVGREDQQVEIRLRRAGAILARVVRDGKVVTDVAGIFACRKEGGNEEDWDHYEVIEAGVIRFEDLEPGRQTVAWLAGEESPRATRTVDVKAGETTTVDFPAGG